MPGSSCSYDPESTVRDRSVILAGATLVVGPLVYFGNVWGHRGSLFVGEIPHVCVKILGISIASLPFLRWF